MHVTCADQDPFVYFLPSKMEGPPPVAELPFLYRCQNGGSPLYTIAKCDSVRT